MVSREWGKLRGMAPRMANESVPGMAVLQCGKQVSAVAMRDIPAFSLLRSQAIPPSVPSINRTDLPSMPVPLHQTLNAGKGVRSRKVAGAREASLTDSIQS